MKHWAAGAALIAGLAGAPALMAQNAVAPAVPADPVPSEWAPDAVTQGATPPATPAPSGATALEQPSALSDIENSISLSRDRVEALKKEIADLTGDRAKQSAELIAAGQRVKLAEAEVGQVEDRLSNLIIAELEVRGRLDGADADIANVLAALERISQHPPPALIVDPSDALGSARSAILMASILPQLNAKAEAVTADLKQLNQIKAEAVAEEARLKANFATLEEEQLRIATLIAARKQGVEQVSAELAAEQEQAIDLAKRASSLKDLVAALAERANNVTAAASNAQTPPPLSGSALTPQAIQVALANSSRSAPAIPFGSAHGYLAAPASGVRVSEFGASDGFGGVSQGLSIVTRADAQVVAPSDGWVLYKGPYLNYGQIVILNGGDGYTVLLAGLNTVAVDIGQFVLRGEPVGTMGSRTIGRTVTTSAGNDRPTLYIELRRNNEPIDPTGWWNEQQQPPTQNG